LRSHDINKRGGIWVDGKKKLVEIIKADSMSKPDQTKKVCDGWLFKKKSMSVGHAFQRAYEDY
jgi:ABC-type branched-subunit amino acid transport system substrate-binding protein